METKIYYIKIGLSLIGITLAILAGIIALEFMSTIEALVVSAGVGRISLLTEDYIYKHWINRDGRLE